MPRLCRLLARNGHAESVAQCPLLGAKRKTCARIELFRFCAGFRTPGCGDHPHARTAGVRKASRHEIAGCGAPTVQRVLWGFGVGVSVGEVEPTLAIGSL